MKRLMGGKMTFPKIWKPFGHGHFNLHENNVHLLIVLQQTLVEMELWFWQWTLPCRCFEFQQKHYLQTEYHRRTVWWKGIHRIFSYFLDGSLKYRIQLRPINQILEMFTLHRPFVFRVFRVNWSWKKFSINAKFFLPTAWMPDECRGEN